MITNDNWQIFRLTEHAIILSRSTQYQLFDKEKVISQHLKSNNTI